MEIKLNQITRVEGEGRIVLKVKDGKVVDTLLNIFEPPRFFEGILIGKKYFTVMDITARICGICPIAYQMSSVQAIESIFGIDIPQDLEILRRLFYFGEWIQSHVLHIFFLHLPDFLNVSSIFEINRINPDIVKIAFNLKRFSSKLIELIGGRTSHPVTVVVGGFSKVPEKDDFTDIIKDIDDVYSDSIKALDFLSKLNFPHYNMEDIIFVCLIDGDNYPILKGDIYCSDGLMVKKDEFLEYFWEYETDHSTAKFSKRRDGRYYLVGPLARFNNSFEKLSSDTKYLAKKYGIEPPIKNPYRSILVRMLEVINSIQLIKEFINSYSYPEKSFKSYEIRQGWGTGISEAPRGILWHGYQVDKNGIIQKAQIVPPTSQNQYIMESEVKNLFLHRKEEDITEIEMDRAEKLIRNHDPCISCATHFLKLDRLYLNNRQ